MRSIQFWSRAGSRAARAPLGMTAKARNAMTGLYEQVRQEAAGQTMAEYALILAGLALVAYGLSPTSGYNFLDDAITALVSKVASLF
jgi:Flp pilus assembly pilin Flp